MKGIQKFPSAVFIRQQASTARLPVLVSETLRDKAGETARSLILQTPWRVSESVFKGRNERTHA